MDSTTVYLIRHGEVEYPLDDNGRKLLYGPDVDLSFEGRRGVELLGKKLLKNNTPIDVLYTSPYPRAVQTTDIIAEIIGVKKIIQIKKLRDALSEGYIGEPYSDLMKVDGNVYNNPRSDKQETIAEISQRMSHVFFSLFRKAEKEKIVIGIVSHGDPLRVLVEHLLHPENPLPNPTTMRDEDYLEKGTALKLVLDSSARVLEHEFINPNKEGKKGIEQKF
ncbi:MAG: histidine phosphatase family protein [bacterium]